MNKFNKNSVEDVRTSEEGLIADVMMALSGREDYDPNKYDTEPERANMLKNIREKVVNQQKIMYGEETCEYDITWNGSPEGLYCIPVNRELMSEDGDENNVEPCVCKVSDFTPTEDQLLGAVIEFNDGYTRIIDEDFIAMVYEDEMVGDGWINIDFGITIVYKPVEVYGLYIDQPGVYMWYDGSDSFVSRISNKYEKIKTINQKYLPEALQFGSEEVGFYLEWDGNTEGLYTPGGYWYKLSDEAPTVDELMGAVCTRNDGEKLIIDDSLTHGEVLIAEDFIDVMGRALIIHDNVVIEGVLFLERGIYLRRDPDAGSWYYASINTRKEVVKTIDPKYMPCNNLVIKAYYDEQRFVANMSYEAARSALYNGASITFIVVDSDDTEELAFTDGVKFYDSKFQIIIHNDVVGNWAIDFNSDNTLVVPGPV